MSYYQNNQPKNYQDRDIGGDIGYPENHNYPNNYQNNNNNQPMNYFDKGNIGYSENPNYSNNDYNYSNNDYNNYNNYNNYESGPIPNVNDGYPPGMQNQPNLNSPTEYHNNNYNYNYNNNNDNNNNNYDMNNNYNNDLNNNNYNNDMDNNYSNDMNNLETSSNNVTYVEETEGYSPLRGGGGTVDREIKNVNNNNNKNERGSTIFGSQIAFMKDDKQRKKHGGLMKCLCCGSKSSWKKCCCIGCCVFILIIAAIVAAILLWAKAPEVEFVSVGPSPYGLKSYETEGSGFNFNFGLVIRVNNPNIVGAKFSKIVAVAFYPGHDVTIGGGNLTNVDIARKANTTINFPFSVKYNSSIDPGFAILLDIAKKCGLTGGTKEQLEIDYDLTLSLKVLLLTVSPTFNKKAFIDCPIQDGQVPNIPGFNISNFDGSTRKVKKIKRNFSTLLDPFL